MRDSQHETRALALLPALTGTSVAKRPYDLRHSALSTWLACHPPAWAQSL
ncbi:hypothetical protein ABT373_10045 [Streptomyces sp. NPDC000070]